MNKLIGLIVAITFVSVTIIHNTTIHRIDFGSFNVHVVKVFNVAVSVTNVNGVRAVAFAKG